MTLLYKMTKPKIALIIVDMQNDFVPGGALAVKEADHIIPLIDQLVHYDFDLKVASKDWHPSNHGSFAIKYGKQSGEVIRLAGIKQILWPVHCVQDTTGSEFVPGWDTKQIHRIFYKGTDPEIDSYSTFFDNDHCKDTGLENYLLENGITDLYFAGLATDYCVKYSVLDACHLGFNTYVIADACRAVNLQPGDDEGAFQKMREAGAHIIALQDVQSQL